MKCVVQVLQVLEGHSGGVLAVAISTDGAKIVSTGSWDKSLRVWSTETGEVMCMTIQRSEINDQFGVIGPVHENASSEIKEDNNFF